MSDTITLDRAALDQLKAEIRQEVTNDLLESGSLTDQLLAQAGIGLPNDTQPRSRPVKGWDKVAVLAKRGGGVWDSFRRETNRYAECAHKKVYSCDCWTKDREHRVKFALGLCACEPGQLEPLTPPQSANKSGDVTNPREPLRRGK